MPPRTASITRRFTRVPMAFFEPSHKPQMPKKMQSSGKTLQYKIGPHSLKTSMSGASPKYVPYRVTTGSGTGMVMMRSPTWSVAAPTTEPAVEAAVDTAEPAVASASVTAGGMSIEAIERLRSHSPKAQAKTQSLRRLHLVTHSR